MPFAPAPTVSSPHITYRQTQCILGKVGQTCGNPFLNGGNIVCYEIYWFKRSGVWVGLTFFEDVELHGGWGSMKVSGKSDLGAYVSFLALVVVTVSEVSPTQSPIQKTVYSAVLPPSLMVFWYKENIVDIWSQHFFKKKMLQHTFLFASFVAFTFFWKWKVVREGGSIKGHKLSPNSEDCKGKGEYRCQKMRRLFWKWPWATLRKCIFL